MGYLAELQRKNLETLMGAEAMGTLPEDTKFTDAKVCRNFLCGMCPHDLFTNTREDLGKCPKVHSGKMKDDYEAALAAAAKNETPSDADYSLKDLEGIRREHERNIIGFVDECNRRINGAHKRLQKTPEENNRTTALLREIGELQAAYDGAIEAVSELGSAGNVEASMEEAAKAEALQAEKKEKEGELQRLTDTSGASGHQKLRVCDVCGAYLSILDSDRRLADHFGGKMHLGYLQLRNTIDEWRNRSSNSNAPTADQSRPTQAPHDAPALSSAANGHSNGAPNGDVSRDSSKRQSDTFDAADGNREREKRRRYD